MNALDPGNHEKPRAAGPQETRSPGRASSPAGLLRAAIAVIALTGAACAGAPAADAPPAAARAVVDPDAPRPTGWLEHLAWVNHAPITPDDLAGRVAVVEFWTFDCINCRRSVPAVRRLEATYAKAGDVILIGIHTPELEHERDPAQVTAAVRDLGLGLAVGRDDDYAAWNAFDNHYWPAFYVLGRDGAVRHVHIGELHFGTPRYDALIDAIDAAREETS